QNGRLAALPPTGRVGGRRGDEQLAPRREAELSGVADVPVVVGAETDGQLQEAEVRGAGRAAGDDGDPGHGRLHGAGQVAEVAAAAGRNGRRGGGGDGRIGRRRGGGVDGRRGRRVCGRRGGRFGRCRGTAVEGGTDGGDQVGDAHLAVAVGIHAR